MDKDKMIADFISCVMILLLALLFVCISYFHDVGPRWIDLFLRLAGSSLIFILGKAYGDWRRSRKDVNK